MKTGELFAALLICALCVIVSGGSAQNNFDVTQGQYQPYGLVPLTESPKEGEQNYTLWENACKSILELDRDLANNPDWLNEKKRDIVTKNKIEEYKCNYHVTQFNLGQYGNRYYSVLSGTKSYGATDWTCKIWYLNNPQNKKDVGPGHKRVGSIRFSMRGNRVVGDYVGPNNTNGSLEGILREKTIEYSIRLNDGKTRSGKLEVRSPDYVFGTWRDDPGLSKDASGEWEFFKQFEYQEKQTQKKNT